MYDWDLRTRRCLGQLLDQGNAGTGGGSSLSLSPDNRFIATGSDCGVVNVYRRSQVGERCRAASVLPRAGSMLLASREDGRSEQSGDSPGHVVCGH